MKIYTTLSKTSFFLTVVTLLPGITLAQGLPPELLGKSSPPALSASPSKGQAIHETANGVWILFDGASKTGPKCAVTFRQDGKILGFSGPKDARPGSIAFTGAEIPAAKKASEVKIELAANGKPITVRALHMTTETGQNMLIVPTTIEETIRSIGDRETVEVKLNGKSVFAVNTEGAFKARNALLKCMSSSTSTLQAELTKTTHSIAGGRSTINGTAFAKVALLTPKQYPPKGSAVGIIPITAEVKQWLETAKRGKAKEYPEAIRKFVSYTTIMDDKGRFKFNNLPAGEYIVSISFDFFGNRYYQQYEGTDAVIDARSGAVVTTNDRYSQQSVSEARGANVQKNVLIKNDGDTVQVVLEKSDVFAKGSILNPR
jgi:hypothetical protein